AAAFFQRAAELTPDRARRAQRALAAAHAKYQAGAFEAALGLLATTASGPLDDLALARLSLLRGQIAFPAGRGSEPPPPRRTAAPAVVRTAARQLGPLDIRLARETYLEALSATLFAGRLALGGGLREVAQAARAAPPAPGPARAADLLLDGLAVVITEGFAAG